VLGVQWHPERMWRSAPGQRRLFVDLVEAAKREREDAAPRPRTRDGGQDDDANAKRVHVG